MKRVPWEGNYFFTTVPVRVQFCFRLENVLRVLFRNGRGRCQLGDVFVVDRMLRLYGRSSSGRPPLLLCVNICHAAAWKDGVSDGLFAWDQPAQSWFQSLSSSAKYLPFSSPEHPARPNHSSPLPVANFKPADPRINKISLRQG
eukprot:2833481-Amphidinium_carterae.1